MPYELTGAWSSDSCLGLRLRIFIRSLWPHPNYPYPVDVRSSDGSRDKTEARPPGIKCSFIFVEISRRGDEKDKH